MPRSNPTRREFLRSTAALAAGALVPYLSTGAFAAGEPSKSKNDRPHIGAIGVGGRGSADLNDAAHRVDVRALQPEELRQDTRVQSPVRRLTGNGGIGILRRVLAKKCCAGRSQGARK